MSQHLDRLQRMITRLETQVNAKQCNDATKTEIDLMSYGFSVVQSGCSTLEQAQMVAELVLRTDEIDYPRARPNNSPS